MTKSAVEPTPDADDDFRGNFHTYVPYKAGLPRLGPYIREVWRRREFLNEMARANVRADQMDTMFGRLWTILNPLLMGVVYFILVNILTDRGTAPGYFAYLLAGLFLFSALTSSMMAGSRSVVKAGKIITNTAFPRVLLPLATVKTAIAQLLPSLVVLAIVAGLTGVRFHWAQLSLIPLLAIFIIFCAGMAMLLATLQVYFRDLNSFLPYLNRIWLYGSPVLWTAAQVPESLRAIEAINPMFAIVGSWSDAIVLGAWPSGMAWALSAGWAIIAFVAGGYFFLSRERDFAVRI